MIPNPDISTEKARLSRWRDGSRRREIATLLAQCDSESKVFDTLWPMVARQQAPWIFTENVNGSRVPKRMGAQASELRYEIQRVNEFLSKED